MARRTKLTPEVQRRICDNIRLGMTYERAAVCAGVCEKTFYVWKAKGEQARSGKHVQFLQALQAAETEGEQRHLATIKAAALGGREFTETATDYDARGKVVKAKTTVKHVLPQWQAAAWILERRHPQRWAKLEKREVSGKDGGELVLKVVYDEQPDGTPEMPAPEAA